MWTGYLFHLNIIHQYFNARENTKMLLLKPQRVQLFPEMIWSLLNCKRWLLALTCGVERLGMSGIIVPMKVTSSFHKIRVSTGFRRRKGGTKNLGTFFISSTALHRAWAPGINGCAEGQHAQCWGGSCSPHPHCSSWKTAASHQGKKCWLQGLGELISWLAVLLGGGEMAALVLGEWEKAAPISHFYVAVFIPLAYVPYQLSFSDDWKQQTYLGHHGGTSFHGMGYTGVPGSK